MTCPPSHPGFEPGGLGHPRGYAAWLSFPHFLELPLFEKGLWSRDTRAYKIFQEQLKQDERQQEKIWKKEA
jgi:hypothetical protein